MHSTALGTVLHLFIVSLHSGVWLSCYILRFVYCKWSKEEFGLCCHVFADSTRWYKCIYQFPDTSYWHWVMGVFFFNCWECSHSWVILRGHCAQSLRIYWNLRMPLRNWKGCRRRSLAAVLSQDRGSCLSWSGIQQQMQGRVRKEVNGRSRLDHSIVTVLSRKWIKSL